MKTWIALLILIGGALLIFYLLPKISEKLGLKVSGEVSTLQTELPYTIRREITVAELPQAIQDAIAEPVAQVTYTPMSQVGTGGRTFRI